MVVIGLNGSKMTDYDNKASQKKLIPEVVVIRPILIVLLVFYHAFAIYSGNPPLERKAMLR